MNRCFRVTTIGVKLALETIRCTAIDFLVSFSLVSAQTNEFMILNRKKLALCLFLLEQFDTFYVHF